MEHTVSSPGWLIGQRGEERPRLEISFQTQWGRDWQDQQMENEETGRRLRKVQTFQTNPEIDDEDEDVPLEELSLLGDKGKESWQKTEISWSGEKEKDSDMEEVVVIKDDDQLPRSASDGNIMSDQSRQKDNVQAREEGPSTKHDSERGLSSHGSSDPSTPGSATTSVARFGIAHNASTHSMSAVDHLGFDGTKSRLELDTFSALLSSQELKSVNKSVNTNSDGIPQRVRDSLSSKGADGDKDMLHGQQIRGLESDHSAHPPGRRGPSCVDGLLCESEFDFGIEDGEALHLSQFTGAVMSPRQVQDFSGTIPKTHAASPGSASSEQMHQDSLSHSAVVAVSTVQDSESHQRTDDEWAEVVPHWSLQSFRSVGEWPTKTSNRG